MKKRIAIPLALFAGIVFVNVSNGDSDSTSDTTATAASNQAPAAAAPADPAAAPAKAPAEAAPAPAEPALVVSAQEMIDVLEGNALKAKNTYEDKRITVSGFVGSIDASGDYFSLLPKPDALIITGVQVYTDEKFLDQVASFNEGQAISVTGTVTGVGEIMGYSVEAETIQ